MANLTLFSKRLKEAREKSDLTQIALAKMINVTPQTISSYEKGKTGEKLKLPTLDKAVLIAEKLGVSLDWLCGSQDNMQGYDLGDNVDMKQFLTILTHSRKLFGETLEIEELSAGFHPETDMYGFIGSWKALLHVHESGALNNELYLICLKNLIEKYATEITVNVEKFLAKNSFDNLIADDNLPF